MVLSHPLLNRAAACLLAVLVAAPVLADSRLSLKRHPSGTMAVDYRDADHLRIANEGGASGYLTTGGEHFLLLTSPDGRKRFAMDMDQYLARDEAPPAVVADLGTVTATRAGRQEVVDGVTGQVYLVNSGHRSWELVLTDDETIAAVTEAVYGAELRMARISRQALSAQPLASELALARALGAPGILRGQLYTLAEWRQGDALPDNQFRLDGDTLVVRDWKDMQDAYH